MRQEFVLILSIYIAVGTILAILSRRFSKRNINDYYLAGGRLDSILAFGTYAATTYSAFMMVGLVGMTYSTGIGALGFELVYLVSTIVLLSTIGYEIWRLSKERNWISPSQMIGDLYGSKIIELAVAAIYLFAMIPYLAAQITGLGIVFEYGGLNWIQALVVSSLIVYSWIVIAGMWSVAITDLYQGLLMFTCGISYIAWLLLHYAPSIGVKYDDLMNAMYSSGLLGLSNFWSLGVFLAYTIPWAFFAITNPQVVVRLYVHRDQKAYSRSVTYFYVFGFIYTLIVVTIGLVAGSLSYLGHIPGNMKWDEVTPFFLRLMHPLLGSLIAVSIIAAAVSTSNSIVLAVSGSLVATSKKLEKLVYARLIDAVLVIAAALIANARIGFIVELSVLTSVILIPIAPVTILGVLARNEISKYTKISAILALVFGTGIACWFSLSLGPRRAFRELLYGAPISLYVLVVSSTLVTIGYVLDRSSRKRKR